MGKRDTVNDAEELIGLCSDNIIEKTRHLIKYGNYIIEVDEFSGKNAGSDTGRN